MATVYEYSLIGDLGGDLNTPQLRKEINDHPTINPDCKTVENFKDKVKIKFNKALSSSEKITLDGLVSDHTSDTSAPKNQFFTIDPKKDGTNNSSYSKIGSFKYNGSDKIGHINYIDVISYMQNGGESYSVRIFDKTNGNVICEKTGLTNTTEEIIDLGDISNVPINESIFELQARHDTKLKKMAYIDSINIYYGN